MDGRGRLLRSVIDRFGLGARDEGAARPPFGPERRGPAARLARTAEIQVASRGNAWLRAGGNADWVYGYDAWNVPLDTPPAAAA